MALWAVASLAEIAPLNDPMPPESGSAPLTVLAVVGIALYGYAALRYAALYRRRRSAIIVAVVTAFVLLAEAMVAVAFARNWHASWWEWHVLMLAAFALIAMAARAQGPAERFSDLYLEATAAGKRDVSVIFADLAGFTAFSDERDPRAVSEMLNAYFQAAIPAVVGHHGGEIDQLIGDAMMATFNTRGDQPDHAQRAAAAALDVQRETAALAAEHPDWPRFRIGVNTGEALVGILGAGRRAQLHGDRRHRQRGQPPAGGGSRGRRGGGRGHAAPPARRARGEPRRPDAARQARAGRRLRARGAALSDALVGARLGRVADAAGRRASGGRPRRDSRPGRAPARGARAWPAAPRPAARRPPAPSASPPDVRRPAGVDRVRGREARVGRQVREQALTLGGLDGQRPQAPGAIPGQQAPDAPAAEAAVVVVEDGDRWGACGHRPLLPCKGTRGLPQLRQRPAGWRAT